MTIARVSYGTLPAGTVSVATGRPAGGAVGDLLLLFVADKYNLPTAPSGFTLLGQQSGGAGAAGVDSGAAVATVFQRLRDGSEPATTTVLVPTGNCLLAYQELLTGSLVQAGTHVWDVVVSKGADNAPGVAWSVTGDVDPGIQAGDYVLAFSAINGNGPAAVGWFSALALTTPGVTYGALADFGDAWTSNGDDMALRGVEAAATAGASSGPPVFAMTASTSTGNQPTGATVIVRLREVPIPTSGALAVILGGAAISAAGAAAVTGAGSSTAGTTIVSASGQALVGGAAAAEMAGAALSASGSAVAAGAAALVSDGAGLSATGTALATGPLPLLFATLTEITPRRGARLTLRGERRGVLTSPAPWRAALLRVR
jgi:hypothetical protein